MPSQAVILNIQTFRLSLFVFFLSSYMKAEQIINPVKNAMVRNTRVRMKATKGGKFRDHNSFRQSITRDLL